MPVAISTRDKTWCKMFPNSFKTEQQSLVFMKKLFAVAISNIVYIRAIFPEYAFFDKHLEGIKLKILREDSKCPGATKVISWVRGCFDALDKKYLRTVIIGLYADPDDPDTVLESYSFKFTYGKTNTSLEINSENGTSTSILNNTEPPEEIKKATISLLRTMILAGSTQNKLPEKVIMTMKLLYYDEVTPDDYEPNGFKTSDYAGFRHETETINAKLGHVDTNHHSFRMILRTDKAAFTENYLKRDKNKENCNSNEKELCSHISNKLQNNDNSLVNNQTENTERNEEHSDEFIVKCPCGGDKDDGIMIMCETCKMWQHSVCFGIIDEKSVPDIHICDMCIDLNPNIDSTNQKIKLMGINERQESCLLRRAIYHCRSFETIDPDQMAEILGIEINVAKGLFHNLQTNGMLINPKRRNKSKCLLKIIDKKVLEEKMLPKYFNLNNVGCTQSRKRLIQNSGNESNLNEELIMDNSQESLFNDGPMNKRPRSCVARTPVVASNNF